MEGDYRATEQRRVEFAGGKTEYTSGTVHQRKADTNEIQREFYVFIEGAGVNTLCWVRRLN